MGGMMGVGAERYAQLNPNQTTAQEQDSAHTGLLMRVSDHRCHVTKRRTKLESIQQICPKRKKPIQHQLSQTGRREMVSELRNARIGAKGWRRLDLYVR